MPDFVISPACAGSAVRQHMRPLSGSILGAQSCTERASVMKRTKLSAVVTAVAGFARGDA